MCCNNLAFLKALQSCGRASDDRERREMTELRKGARRGVDEDRTKHWPSASERKITLEPVLGAGITFNTQCD